MEIENYLIERMNYSPIFIGLWCEYKEINTLEVIKTGLRWIIIQNGILFWYLDDIMSAPEGFLSLSTSDINIEEEKKENEELEELDEEIQNKKVVVTIIPKNSNTVIFTFSKSNETLVREIIQKNIQVERNPMNLQEFHLENVDEPQLGSMQIHLKGVPHTIEIYVTDDARKVAEDFVVEHKLKQEIITRIENELLHTQIDTCLLSQSKLRQHVSHLRRLIIDSFDSESRLLASEYHIHQLSSTSEKLTEKVLPLIENKLIQLKDIIKKKEKKINKLEKQNQSSQVIIQKLFENIKQKQKNEKNLIFHCHELEEKLKRSIEIIQDPFMSGLLSHQKNNQIIRNLNNELNENATNNSISNQDLSETFDEKSNNNNNNDNNNSLVEKLAVETSEALTVAMDTLRFEYEKKIEEYEKQINEDQVLIEEVNNQNSNNNKMILSLKEEINQLQKQLYDRKDQFQKKTENELQQIKQNSDKKISEAEEQNKQLQLLNNELKTSLNQLQTKYDLSLLQYNTLTTRSNEQAEELQDLKNKMIEVTKTLNNSNILKLQEENRMLNEQAVTLRGEILRLQSEVQNIQEKAIQAVHVVQLLDKDGHNSSNQSKKLSTKNLLQSQSQNQLQNQLQNLPQNQLQNQPQQEEKNQELDEHDPEIVVELTLEPDEDDDNYNYNNQVEQKQQLNSNNFLEKVDTNEKYAETEVDLMLHQSIVNLKLEEKNIGSLSPVVEDRLLRNIYHHYALETTGYLTLSRFGRFTKEFKLAGNPSSLDSNNHHSNPMLVYGDIDIIYVTTLKKVPLDNNNNNSLDSTPTHNHEESNKKVSSPAFIPAGKVHPNDYPVLGSANKATSSHMTVKQFLLAIKELAIRLYTHLIEAKTGTVYECLPQQQKEEVTRSVLDIFMLKRIVPIADQLGLIPWELMILDQSLTTIHSSPNVSSDLVNHIHVTISWYTHYSHIIQISSNNSNSNNNNNHGSNNGNGIGFSTSSYLNLNSNTGINGVNTPPTNERIKSLKSQSYSNAYSPVNQNYQSPHQLKSSSLSQYSTVYSSPQQFSSSSSQVYSSPGTLHQQHFKGISYKEISKFYHDYGIVPYLLKEPQLFNIFKEVFLWARSNLELLLIALPEDIRNHLTTQQEYQATPLLKMKYPKKHIIGFGSFIILFCSVATQAFKELPSEKRLNRLFQWSAQSGGSYLMQQKLNSNTH